MKIVYCINAVSNSGGMERILQQKANYLADVAGYDVIIVTTEQGDLPPYFPFSSKIRIIDLDVDYGDRADKKKKNIVWKVIWKGIHKPIHKKRLTKVLLSEKPDIVITLINNDIGFLPSIMDGSKKLVEFHFSYSYKLIEAHNKLVRFVQKCRLHFWKKNLAKFDKFVVLTHEDKQAWGEMANITVIPNFIPSLSESYSNCKNERVIAVGRAEYQKGFDLLIQAWSIVKDKYPNWHLDIFGGGVKDDLELLIRENNLYSYITLHPATKNIGLEYVNSSLFVLSSRYEGLPMVLLEAMSYGLPIVAFDCPCGPKDIVKQEFGTLVRSDDFKQLALAMMDWMADDIVRIKGGYASRSAVLYYSQDEIMKKWIQLFQSLFDHDEKDS